MEGLDLRRLIVRHRHVAPMLSVLLASTNARVTITDADGKVILDRQAGTGPADAPSERHPIVVEGTTVGWIDGPRPSAAIAAVLAYACAREADKRALAREALDRYRELNLLYDLADQIGATLEIDAVARVAVTEASRLPAGGKGFVLLRVPGDGPDAAEAPLVVRPTDSLDAWPDGDADEQFAPDGRSGIIGAILAGDPEIVNDIGADPRSTPHERQFASLVAAPLRVRGERIGVIGTISHEPREFHASDLRLLTAIASLAAPTFDQAAVHEASLRPAPGAD